MPELPEVEVVRCFLESHIVGKKILKDLKFDKKKTIISLISTIKLNDLKKSTGVKKVCKAIPLPFVENRLGPIILSPKNKIAKRIFSKLGPVIEINNEKAADLGVSIQAIGRSIETMFGSRKVTKFTKQGKEYSIVLQSDIKNRQEPSNLNKIYVTLVNFG